MGSAPLQRLGIAAGILATSRNFGMVFGRRSVWSDIHLPFDENFAASSITFFTAVPTTFLVAAVICLYWIDYGDFKFRQENMYEDLYVIILNLSEFKITVINPIQAMTAATKNVV